MFRALVIYNLITNDSNQFWWWVMKILWFIVWESRRGVETRAAPIGLTWEASVGLLMKVLLSFVSLRYLMSAARWRSDERLHWIEFLSFIWKGCRATWVLLSWSKSNWTLNYLRAKNWDTIIFEFHLEATDSHIHYDFQWEAYRSFEMHQDS